MEFLYTLKLNPRLHGNNSWAEQDEQIVREHFQKLKDLTEQGIVILAGRTTREDSTDFGIVILETQSQEDAKQIMEEDPAVVHGIMTAELFPFGVALLKDTT